MRILILLTSILFLFSCKETPKSNTPTSTEATEKKDTTTLDDGKMLAINGTQIFVKTIGQGEPILVIHGGPGLDHTYFLPQMEGLAKDHELIFYDQRASGKSSANLDSTQVSLDLFIEDIEAIRQGFQLKKINILGHSFGGILAMKYAIKHPEKVDKLILSNSSGAAAKYMRQESEKLQARITEDDRLAQQLVIQSDNFKAGKASAYEDLFRIFFQKEFFNREMAEQLTLTFPPNFVQNTKTLGYLNKDMGANYDFEAELAQIKAPTLVLYGDFEILSTSAGKAIADKIPDATFVSLKDCGHFPFIEKPEAYFKEITSFLK